jgi:Tfp pilus assembly protein PilO
VKKQISLTPVLAIAFVIVAAVVWFALVSPKQARSGELDEQIEQVESQLALARRDEKAEPETPDVAIEVADVFRLAKAMPDRDDMPGIILELNSIALSTGVRFVSIQPSTPVTRGAYHALPVALTFEGNYYDLTDFLFRLRNLVSVRDGILAATGRLYSLDAIQFNEGPKGFPNITAILTISAYAYGAAPGDAPPAPTAPPTETSTTGTTETVETGSTTTEEGPPADPTGDGNSQAAPGGNG